MIIMHLPIRERRKSQILRTDLAQWGWKVKEKRGDDNVGTGGLLAISFTIW